MDYLGKDFSFGYGDLSVTDYAPSSVRGVIKWNKPKRITSSVGRILVLRRQRIDMVKAPVAAEPRKNIKAQFKSLTKRWKRETESMSSPTQTAMHPAYQRIIGFGPAALPLIIAELKREPDWWFWALRAITGAEPVGDAERGRLNAMTNAWLRWWAIEGTTERWKV